MVLLAEQLGREAAFDLDQPGTQVTGHGGPAVDFVHDIDVDRRVVVQPCADLVEDCLQFRQRGLADAYSPSEEAGPVHLEREPHQAAECDEEHGDDNQRCPPIDCVHNHRRDAEDNGGRRQRKQQARMLSRMEQGADIQRPHRYRADRRRRQVQRNVRHSRIRGGIGTTPEITSTRRPVHGRRIRCRLLANRTG